MSSINAQQWQEQLATVTHISGRLRVHDGCSITLPALQTVGLCTLVTYGATLNAPAMQTAEHINVGAGGTLNAPALRRACDVEIMEGGVLKAPRLHTVSTLRVATSDVPV